MSGKPNDKMFKTMVRKHGSEKAARAWFKEIGAMGGKASTTGGFYKDRELASRAGRKGGKISRRKPVFVIDDTPFEEGFNEPSVWDKLRMRFL